MAKIKFELNIDEIIECAGFPSNDNATFYGEQAKDKTFLFVDKLTGDMQAFVCREPADSGRTYAHTVSFFIPKNVTIINDEEDDDTGKIMEQIKAAAELVAKEIIESKELIYDKVNNVQEEIMNSLTFLSENTGSGISEKTLLSALDIVTRKSNN